jgi:hypothetical protein
VSAARFKEFRGAIREGTLLGPSDEKGAYFDEPVRFERLAKLARQLRLAGSYGNPADTFHSLRLGSALKREKEKVAVVDLADAWSDVVEVRPSAPLHDVGVNFFLEIGRNCAAPGALSLWTARGPKSFHPELSTQGEAVAAGRPVQHAAFTLEHLQLGTSDPIDLAKALRDYHDRHEGLPEWLAGTLDGRSRATMGLPRPMHVILSDLAAGGKSCTGTLGILGANLRPDPRF